MSLPNLPFATQIPSRQLVSGQHVNEFNNLLSSFGQLAALAGGGLSGLTPVISNAFTEITIVSTDEDSVQLPVAKVGLRCVVTNAGANAAQVFGHLGTTDTVQGVAGATGVALAAGATALYMCRKNGVWSRFVSA